MKKIFTIISILALVQTASAQQLPLYSQYMYNPFLYNPSMTGFAEMPSIYLIHRQQWRDMPGSPVTNAMTVDGKFHGNTKIGLGAYVYQDITDMVERLGLGGAYSYTLQLSGDHYLLGGISFGVTENKIDFSKAIVMDKDDPFLYSDLRRKVSLDAAFGLTYKWNDLKVGLSVPQLLGNDVKYMSSESSAYYHLSRHFTANASYSFYLSEPNLVKMEPSVMMRAVKGAPIQIDGNVNMSWKDFLFWGFSYRSSYAVGANIGVKLNNALSAGYYYDFVISEIGPYSGGGHEFMLGYSFGKKKEEKKEEISKEQQMTDSLLMVLKKENVDQKNSIDSLRTAIVDLKSNPNTSGSNSGNKDSVPEWKKNPVNTNPIDTNSMMRKADLNEFKAETGSVIEKGFYVVVGAYKSEENAKTERDKWIKIGYQTSKVIFNQKRKLFYTYVLHTAVKDAAVSELTEVRPGATDSWIFEMQ